MSVAIGFRPSSDLVQPADAFHAGREEFRAERGDASAGGRLALMRHAYVTDSDEQALAEMTEDLVRLGGVHGHGEGSRAERRAHAAEAAHRLIAGEIYLAGGPGTVAAMIGRARDLLGIDLFLADLYGAGIDGERIQRTLRRLAGPVRDALHATAGVA
jgi:hypothetical protein